MDLFYIPRYVEQANKHPYFKDLVELEKKHFKKVSFSVCQNSNGNWKCVMND